LLFVARADATEPVAFARAVSAMLPLLLRAAVAFPPTVVAVAPTPTICWPEA
jgi:hypothetical protein